MEADIAESFSLFLRWSWLVLVGWLYFALLEVELQTDESIGELLGFIVGGEASCRYQQHDDVLGGDVSDASLSIILFLFLKRNKQFRTTGIDMGHGTS